MKRIVTVVAFVAVSLLCAAPALAQKQPTLGLGNWRGIWATSNAVTSVPDQLAVSKASAKDKDALKFIEDAKELGLLAELMENLQDSPKCDGIVLTKTENRKTANFVVNVMDMDSGSDNRYTWLLVDQRKGEGHLGGFGARGTMKDVARDICWTVWDDVDSKHFKRKGITIE